MPLSPEQMNNDLNVEGTEPSRTENKDELEEMVNISEEDKLGE